MIELRQTKLKEIEIAIEIIASAKKHLKEQGIDQWQTDYPDYNCIYKDIISEKAFFVTEDNEILGYICIDYDGESAYEHLKGEWQTSGKYVVVHRIAFTENARGKGISGKVFSLVQEMSRKNGISSFRVDTDAGNKKMRHILEKNGFSYRGTILFDNSEKIAFDKTF